MKMAAPPSPHRDALKLGLFSDQAEKVVDGLVPIMAQAVEKFSLAAPETIRDHDTRHLLDGGEMWARP
jgi:hypothetical protein